MLPIKVTKKPQKNVPLPPSFSNPSLMFYMKIAFIFLGMEELVVAGIKHTKINTSVIICTLSSVFKIHAGWDVLNLEMRALCWWRSRPNRNFSVARHYFLRQSLDWLTPPSRACRPGVTLLVVTGFSGTLTSTTVCEALRTALATWQVVAMDALAVPLGGSECRVRVSGRQGPLRAGWSLF